MGKEDQIILGLPKAVLFPVNFMEFQGFRGDPSIDYERIILTRGQWYRRGDIEQNPAIKHVIPYCPVVDEHGRVFLYQRSSKGGEGRLHGNYSIGIGGHVERVDGASGNPIHVALARELSEEVDVRDHSLEKLGCINDDSNPVGQVHFGLVYVVTTKDGVTKKDEEIASGGMVPIEEIVSMDQGQFENWSRLLVSPLQRWLATR